MRKILILKLISGFIITLSLLLGHNLKHALAANESSSCFVKVEYTDTSGRVHYINGATVHFVAVFGSDTLAVTKTTGTGGSATFNWQDYGKPVGALFEPKEATITTPGYKPSPITVTTFGYRADIKNCWKILEVLPDTPGGTGCTQFTGTVKDQGGVAINNVSIVAQTTAGTLSATSNMLGTYTINPPSGSPPFQVSTVTATDTAGNTTTESGLEHVCSKDITISTSTTTPGTVMPNAAVPQNLMHNIQLLAIAIGAIIAIIRIILGSFILMGKGDNPMALEEGRDMITSSILGLLVILFAVTLLKVIGSNVLGILKQ